MVVDALRLLGPCLSTELAEFLIEQHGLSPAAARQRISRAPSEVKRLGHLPFSRKARFLYLKDEYASPRYWENLYRSIYASQNAYSRALGAVAGRVVVPIEQFMVSCGAPISQKRHISADTVLKRMLDANVLVTETYPGLGECVLTKQTKEDILHHGEDALLAEVRSRIIAEGILLDSIKEWLRRLALASYNKVCIRPDSAAQSRKVGNFIWDLTAPSYIAGITSWKCKKISPGFVVCDVLLEDGITTEHIEPFLYKAKTLQALNKVGRTMFFFVAGRYEPAAFKALRESGIIPATSESLFGKDIAEAFGDLILSLKNAAKGSLDPAKFDDLFCRLGKLEGAAGNMRGALFEFVVAELIRKTSPTQVQLNKICNGEDGKAEVDVWELKEGVVARMVECKGMAPGAPVDDEEIHLWLTKRITRVRHHLKNLDWKGPKPSFELWTSGLISDKSLQRIDKTRAANIAKFDLHVGKRPVIPS